MKTTFSLFHTVALIVAVVGAFWCVTAELDLDPQISPYTNANEPLFVLPRQDAMAGANLAFGRDGTSQSNPAILMLEKGNEILLGHGGLSNPGQSGRVFSSTILSYVGTVGDKHGIGASVGYLLVPDIEVTEDFDTLDSGDPIWDEAKLRYESVSEAVLNVAYGRSFQLTPQIVLGLGGSIHGMRRRIIDETGFGVGVDLGAALDFPKTGFRMSVLAEDITTNFIYWTSSYQEIGTPSLRLGCGYSKNAPYLYNRSLTVSYATPDLLMNDGALLVHDQTTDDVDTVESGSLLDNPAALIRSGSFALEYVVLGLVPLRVGYTAGEIHLGSGVIGGGELMPIGLSYEASVSTPSFLGGSPDLGATWIFSIGYRW